MPAALHQGKWRWQPVLTATAVALTYGASRLWGLLALPMFTDEGIYISWALHALHARRIEDLLISITDGKYPLFPWLMVPVLLTVPDRLLAARLVSVASGAVALVGLYLVVARLYTRPVAVIAMALYIAAPAAYFYDRLALYDGLMAALAMVVLATSLWWQDTMSYRRTALLGLVMGMAMCTKLSAAAFVLPAPFIPLLIWPSSRWWRAAGTYFIAAAIFGVFWMHPSASILVHGTTDRYSFTLDELWRVPWHTWWRNAEDLAQHLAGFLPAPLWQLCVAGLALPVVTRSRRDVAMVCWALLLLGSIFAVSKVFYFRYYLPGVLALLIPAARLLWLMCSGAASMVSRALPLGRRVFVTPAVAVGALAAATLPSIWVVWALASDPLTAPLPDGPRSDREQYVVGHNAGWHTRGLTDVLASEAANGPIVVAVSPLTGQMRAWVEANLAYRPNVHILLRDPTKLPHDEILARDRNDTLRRLALAEGRVFLAVSEWSDSPFAQPFVQDNVVRARLVADFPRDGMNWRHRAYEIQMPRSVRSVHPPLPVQFGDGIRLDSYEIEAQADGTLGAIDLTLYWRAERPLGRPFALFAHLVTESSDADKVAQHDGQPGNGLLPTDRWQVAEVIEDRRRLDPRGPSCGAYRVLIGWYSTDTGERLPVRASGYAVRNSALELASIQNRAC